MEQHATRTAPKCATCKYYGQNAHEHQIAREWQKNMAMFGAGFWLPDPLCKSPYTPVELEFGREITLAKEMRENEEKCGENGNWYVMEDPLPEPTPEPALEIEPTPQPKRKWWQFGGK